MKKQTNSQLQLAFDFVCNTNQNVFLTGKAGTGKTTFLKDLRNKTFKRMIVVAPTGVAAINAGGVTIHSFFQMSFGPQVPQTNPSLSINEPNGSNAPTNIKRFNKEKINIIRSLDLLVIDEISMVRADMLDAIDEVLRRFRDKRKVFGGVQLLMIGDMQQLAPIIKEDERSILSQYYDQFYFFGSKALKEAGFISIELKHIFRQEDEKFIKILNQIRNNTPDEKVLKELNQRYVPDFNPKDEEGYIVLSTHNKQVQYINQQKLNALKTESVISQAEVIGEFPEYIYPTEEELELKLGAQVMFVKNDISVEKRYYNGKIGRISKLDEYGIKVVCPEDDEPISVERVEWQNAKYSINKETGVIVENVIGTFEQFPLKLAWAITIHKSQGLTFEKAIIDAQMSFAFGQVYVALSRCKSLEGMVLKTPIKTHSIKNDRSIVSFNEKVEENQPGTEELLKSKKEYQYQLLTELFDFNPMLWQIKYLIKLCNQHGTVLLGNLYAQLQTMINPLNNEVIAVSSKFGYQMRELVAQSEEIEQNDILQERIKKACNYFLEKINLHIEKPLKETEYQTDNKEVKRSLKEGFERFSRELKIKRSSLEVCKEGFILKNYLETKAKASLDLKAAAYKSGSPAATISKFPDFFKQIHNWRLEKSKAEQIEVSKVMPQKTMLGIADALPATVADLKAVKGMGGKKLKQYGKEILKLLIAYRKEKGMSIPDDPEKEIESAGLDSKHLSFKLYQEGHKIPEIALERKMAITTIEQHLAHFIASGEIKVEQLVEAHRVEIIKDFFKKNYTNTLSEAKRKLRDEYSYAELRFVLSSMKK